MCMEISIQIKTNRHEKGLITQNFKLFCFVFKGDELYMSSVP